MVGLYSTVRGQPQLLFLCVHRKGLFVAYQKASILQIVEEEYRQVRFRLSQGTKKCFHYVVVQRMNRRDKLVFLSLGIVTDVLFYGHFT